PTVKPKIEIKMAPHKPRKSSSIQDTDDEDMIVYDYGGTNRITEEK
ncbi:hypothetical protein TNCV_422521, partial [Trichonephila clavipes]